MSKRETQNPRRAEALLDAGGPEDWVVVAEPTKKTGIKRPIYWGKTGWHLGYENAVRYTEADAESLARHVIPPKGYGDARHARYDVLSESKAEKTTKRVTHKFTVEMEAPYGVKKVKAALALRAMIRNGETDARDEVEDSGTDPLAKLIASSTFKVLSGSSHEQPVDQGMRY